MDNTAQALQKLDRLEGYLLQDSSNLPLLADAFQTALRCSQWERAAFHLRHAQALQPQSQAWALREADLYLAQSDYAKASEVLQALQAMPAQPPEFADAVLHNLAFIQLQSHGPTACVDALRAHMESPQAPAPQPALARLWLRALHHARQPEQATDWARAFEARNLLVPSVAGPASLAALDANCMAEAQRWSNLALQQAEADDAPIEALVTQSSLALAANNAPQAQAAAEAALRINPQDGRAWSALAFASLLAGQFPTARQQFAQALSAMPQHIGTWHGQGWTQIVQQDLEGAKRSFESALALDRNFAESHGGLAVACALGQDTSGAQLHIDRALRLDPANLSGRFAQAVLEAGINDPQSFQRLVKRLLTNQSGPLGESVLDLVSKASTPKGTS
ncbi:hypothetical protein GCM10027195_44230 [Comamonas sediminis]